MKNPIEQQVDRLLLEQGEYRPLELLLWEDRLDTPDYEAWIMGELSYLADRLFGDPQQIALNLRQAADYLSRRGWESVPIHYTRRGQPQGPHLRFSADSRLDELFHTRYRKPRHEPQFDLFSDTASTVRVNGLIQALIEQNEDEARLALEQLYEAAPDHAHLGELERLYEALASLRAPVHDAAHTLQRLDSETTPLAQRHLGTACQAFLKPLWRQLSDALRNHPFSSDQANLHPSYTAGKHEDWDRVRQAVEDEPAWQQERILLERHAIACHHLAAQTEAMLSWFRHCWRFADHAPAFSLCNDTQLDKAWQLFLDLEPELATCDFPAWLLLHNPGLARGAPSGQQEPDCPESYRVIFALQAARFNHEAGSAEPNLIALRAKLKPLSEDLFQHFLHTC